MPQPAAVNASAEALVSVYQRAWIEIMREQQRALGLRNRRKRRRLLADVERRINQQLDAVDAATRRWISVNYPVIYRSGAQAGAAAAGSAFTEWTGTHLNAIQRLARDTFNDLLEATQFVRQDTKRFIRESAKIASDLTVRGTPALRGGTDLERVLRDRGIKAIIYRDGTKHGLAEYAQMVVRTKTATAYNIATLNAGQAAGVQWFEVLDGPDCGWTRHDDPERALGSFRTYEESMEWPISHPQCRRSFAARPDITAASQIATAARSSTPAQADDIRQADAARASLRRSRRQRVRRRDRTRR